MTACTFVYFYWKKPFINVFFLSEDVSRAIFKNSVLNELMGPNNVSKLFRLCVRRGVEFSPGDDESTLAILSHKSTEVPGILSKCGTQRSIASAILIKLCKAIYAIFK
jgi:hypothetical protein